MLTHLYSLSVKSSKLWFFIETILKLHFEIKLDIIEFLEFGTPFIFPLISLSRVPDDVQKLFSVSEL